MRNAIVRVCITILLLTSVCFLTGCCLLWGKDALTSGNLMCHTHYIRKICFAGAYTWDSQSNVAVLDIPDSCGEYRVSALGGYVGSGAPVPFFVSIPDAIFCCKEETLPQDAEIEYYHLILNIGRYVRDDKFIVMDEFHNVGENQFIQILVTVSCSEENQDFYAEDGKLYRKSDDSLVEGFYYYSDYCE